MVHGCWMRITTPQVLLYCGVLQHHTGSHSVASMNGTWWILKLGDDNQQSTLVPLVCSLVIIILIIIIIVIVIIVIFYVHAGMIVIAFFYSYRMMDDR